MITDKNIDNGKPFDWGKASKDYAKYRDIYPKQLFEKLEELGVAKAGDEVLDLGTGTGVLPRAMCKYGAHFTGADISLEQIAEAKKLSKGMNIDYLVSSAENINFSEASFDSITACQCCFYFNHDILAKKAFDLLKPGGKLVFIIMAWLPFESEIASASENLVLKYNPKWSGSGFTKKPIYISPAYNRYFEKANEIMFDIDVPFTRESWAGRMRACRGVGASLSAEDVQLFDKEHKELLSNIAPENFTIIHGCMITVLKKK